ncbi:MAG: hypothetical protein DRP72_02160 [Candidatus Omnitrophota bacterium]|nr:MAG: hypothetical protein DRP72_02160 [Candidatus Omnitrophota bacterium]
MKISSVIICGQLVTSRTETLEEYFRNKLDLLTVIGITSPFAPYNVSRCSVYRSGKLIREFRLLGFQIGSMRWYKQPMLFISFSMYIISIFYAVLRLRQKFDLFIGISCFSAFMGVLLKRLKFIKKVIYYSIDYYPKPQKFSFGTLIVIAFRIVDKFCVKNTDLIWHISPRIAEARYKYAKIPPNSYKYLVAPLTYDAKILRFKQIDDVERYTIGFVGTLSENQGLQLLIKAMPQVIRRVPEVKVRIIGKGPYEAELKRMVRNLKLDDYFIFHGFIKSDGEVLDILSRCAVGVAPWTCREDDNVLYADPGKPKLYAFCGLPIIITKGTLIAEEISNKRVGISINYTEDELVEAIVGLFKDKNKLREYKKNAHEFAKQYTTDVIFDSILKSVKDLI